MSENEAELLEGLRALSAEGPQAPSQRLEARLTAEFRRHKRLHRWAVWGPVAGTIAAGLAVGLWLVPTQVHPPHGAPMSAVLESAGDLGGSFYPVPGADGLPPYENAMVVRVELPVSSLRLMGLPVPGAGVEPVQADVLLGQDGLARGVRFVQ